MTFTFKHPKYYKELRKAGNELTQRSVVKEDLASSGSSPARNKSDQAISNNDGLAQPVSVRPDPGLKQQAASDNPQAASDKPTEPQASSGKLQASSNKLQAPSHKRQAP
tara:strand:+ start:228 stop:554 length:327 start_codon:yes stop_codon:yes gene_type:complete